MQFVSFQATAAHTCPRSHTQFCVPLHTKLGWTLPVPVPVPGCLSGAPPLPLNVTQHTHSCHHCLTPQLLPAHHLGLIPADLHLLQQTHLPAVLQIIDLHCHLCKKCSCFDKERAVLECPSEPPQHSWTSSGVGVTTQLGGPVYLLLSVWRLKTLQFSSASQKTCVLYLSHREMLPGLCRK